MNIAFIPARGGSKGLYKKNIAEMCGKPLIWYTIHAALESSLVDKLYITTDDPEIADVASRFCENIIMRPDELARDDTPTLPVIQHALDNIPEKNICSNIIVLQATSPLRTGPQIDEAIKLKSDEFSSVVSVCEAEHTPYKMYSINEDTLIDFINKSWRGTPRQKIPKVYRETGAVYVTTALTLEHGSITGERPRPYIMSHDDSVDIDNKHDLMIAEMYLMERRK